MKWVSMLLLTLVFVSCAHQNRQISSTDDQENPQHRERFGFQDPYGARY